MIFPTISVGRELGNCSAGGSGSVSLMNLQSIVSGGCTWRWLDLHDPHQSGSLTRVARWWWRLARGLFLSSGPFCQPLWVFWRYSSWLPPGWTIQETKLTGPCLLRPSVGPNRHVYSILLLTQAALVQCERAYTKAWVPGGVAHRGHAGCCYHQYSSSQISFKLISLLTNIGRQQDIPLHQISAYLSETMNNWNHLREFCSTSIDNTKNPSKSLGLFLNIQRPLDSTTFRQPLLTFWQVLPDFFMSFHWLPS